MDILKLIKKDHDEALDMISRLESMTSEPSPEAERLVRDLCIGITLHAKSEEKALYEECKSSHEDLKEFALQSYIEHHLVEATLHKLISVKPGGNGQFKAALAVIKDLFEHHGREEEEQEMFPKFRSIFSDEKRDEMGVLMIETKERMRSGIEKMFGVAPLVKEKPAATAAAAVKPKSKAPAKKISLKKAPMKGKRKTSEKSHRSM